VCSHDRADGAVGSKWTHAALACSHEGIAGPNWLIPEAILSMASNPIVFAYAGPYRAIWPWQAREIRADLILVTDSFEHSNELAICLASSFVFRGVVGVRARRINETMKIDSGETRTSFPHPSPPIDPYFYPFLVDVPSPFFDHGQSS
jgi:malic enzyme